MWHHTFFVLTAVAPHSDRFMHYTVDKKAKQWRAFSACADVSTGQTGCLALGTRIDSEKADSLS
jgi:hypothetical protein